MQTNTIKISSKGQIAIPRNIRDQLDADFLLMQYDRQANSIILSPLKDRSALGGSLKQYAKQYISIDDAREILREQARDECIRS